MKLEYSNSNHKMPEVTKTVNQNNQKVTKLGRLQDDFFTFGSVCLQKKPNTIFAVYDFLLITLI